jgi:hypothetical protein
MEADGVGVNPKVLRDIHDGHRLGRGAQHRDDQLSPLVSPSVWT